VRALNACGDVGAGDVEVVVGREGVETRCGLRAAGLGGRRTLVV